MWPIVHYITCAEKRGTFGCWGKYFHPQLLFCTNHTIRGEHLGFVFGYINNKEQDGDAAGVITPNYLIQSQLGGKVSHCLEHYVEICSTAERRGFLLRTRN